ncbi:hypothetical protein Lal_00017063 [Lupinus albus]|nr:hypothetical protein Lal_00017063 [Lupinus albus]
MPLYTLPINHNTSRSSSFLLFVMLVSSSKSCQGHEHDLLHKIGSEFPNIGIRAHRFIRGA